MNFNLYKEDVIRHELGHWLTARELGFGVGSIEINILQNRIGLGHEGVATILPCHRIEEIECLNNYVKNRIAILFSGVLSQVMAKDEAEVNSDLVEGLLASDGADDNSKIIELCHILRGSLYKDNMSAENELEQRNEIMNACWEIACSTLKKNKKLIGFLVDKICSEVIQSNKKYTFDKSQIESWISDFKS